MKLSNFKLKEVIGNSPLTWRFVAEVDVETGRFFKKVERREIYRTFATSWLFSDTGQYTPWEQARELEKACEARHRKPLEQIQPE